MTWETIIKEKLLLNEGISRAAIHGLDGTCYASTENFTVCISKLFSAVGQKDLAAEVVKCTLEISCLK